MKKKTAVVVAAIIAAVALIWSFAPNPVEPAADGKPVVKIGVNMFLSGDEAYLARGIRNALELAMEDLDKSKLKNDYVLIFEDNGFDAKKALSANKKLLAIDKVDAILDASSKVGLITAPMAEEHKVIHLAAATDANVANGKYNFIYWTMPERQVDLMVRKIEDMGIKDVGIVTAIDQATEAMAEDLKAKLSRKNIPFSENKINYQDKDFGLLVDQLKAEDRGLYVLLAYSPALDIILKRFAEKMPGAQIASIESFSFLEDKSAVEGKWYIDAAELKPEYYDRFKEHSGSDNIWGAGNFYDMLNLVVQAFERASSKERAIDELTKIKQYKGLIGDVEQDDRGIFQSGAIVKKIVNGKAEAVE